jgi:hypothetical protein
VHEAAHAVVQHLLGGVVSCVVLDKHGGGDGLPRRDAILALHAGRQAQIRVDATARELDWAIDMNLAACLLSEELSAVFDEEILNDDCVFEGAEGRAMFAVNSILDNEVVWDVIEAVAAGLIVRNGKLGGDDFRSIVEPMLPEDRMDALRLAARQWFV